MATAEDAPQRIRTLEPMLDKAFPRLRQNAAISVGPLMSTDGTDD